MMVNLDETGLSDSIQREIGLSINTAKKVSKAELTLTLNRTC